jgi:hypothetical protein
MVPGPLKTMKYLITCSFVFKFAFYPRIQIRNYSSSSFVSIFFRKYSGYFLFLLTRVDFYDFVDCFVTAGQFFYLIIIRNILHRALSLRPEKIVRIDLFGSVTTAKSQQLIAIKINYGFTSRNRRVAKCGQINII